MDSDYERLRAAGYAMSATGFWMRPGGGLELVSTEAALKELAEKEDENQ